MIDRSLWAANCDSIFFGQPSGILNEKPEASWLTMGFAAVNPKGVEENQSECAFLSRNLASAPDLNNHELNKSKVRASLI